MSMGSGIPDNPAMNFAKVSLISVRIDALTDLLGRWTAWLVGVVILLLFGQWPLREVFGGGHIMANDFGQIMHAAVFMFGLSYALRWDRHVRMDVFYRRWSARVQAMVDLSGSLLFVLPWCALMVWYGAPLMLRSAMVAEKFPDTWSPGYFIFKALPIVCFTLLGLQAIALALRSMATLAATARAESSA